MLVTLLVDYLALVYDNLLQSCRLFVFAEQAGLFFEGEDLFSIVHYF